MASDAHAWVLDDGSTVIIATADIKDWQQVGSNGSLVDIITNKGKFRVKWPVDKIRSRLEDIGWQSSSRPVPLFNNPAETEEIARLRRIVTEGLGDSEFELTGIKAGDNGEVLGVFRKKVI